MILKGEKGGLEALEPIKFKEMIEEVIYIKPLVSYDTIKKNKTLFFVEEESE